MREFITELKERRVLPAIGVYVGGCWVVVEILDRLVQRYLLSPYITDIVFWGLYSLIPAVLLVAWSYGRPGKDKATRAQKVGVPINLIATLGLLITVFGGKDLGATAKVLTVANEEGQTETHYVPSENYRRRMAVFFFCNDSGDPQLDWLQYGVTELLVQDLQQDPFVLATSPWANWGNGLYSRMRSAGFGDGLHVPKSLMRDLADDANRQYFVEGCIGRSDGEYAVTARIWETRTLAQVRDITLTGRDLYSLLDGVSRGIREALDVPSGERIAEDLPLAETYGESQTALRRYIEALNVRLFRNDIEAANGLLDQALQADPNFVLAWFFKGLNQFESGDLPAAQEAFAKARELDYRLPERDRATLKQIGYRLAGENDKLIAFLRLQTQLRNDASSHITLAAMLMAMGQHEAAKGEFLVALERDPMSLGALVNLAHLARLTGDMDGAVAYAKRFEQAKPEDEDAQVLLGDLLRDSGELDQAREHYQQAQLLAESPVVALLRLADLVARGGDTARARALLGEADAQVRSPMESFWVRHATAQLEMRLGRMRAAIEQMKSQHKYAVQALPPLSVALATYAPMAEAYLELNDLEGATGALDTARAAIAPPLDQFLAFSEAALDLQRGDFDQAEADIERGQQILRQFNFDGLQFQVDMLHARSLELQESYREAAEAQADALQRFKRSIVGLEDYQALPVIYARLAKLQIEASMLDQAEQTLAEGFLLDPNLPQLWLQKARHQLARGMIPLAAASVQYALAIWADADPECRHYSEARALAKEIGI